MTVRSLFFGPLLAMGCGQQPDATSVTTPGPSAEPASFVGRETCVACHRQQADLWAGSDHDLAMQPADERTVLGDFDDASFTQNDVTSSFFKHDGAFFLGTDGPDGAMHEYEIAYTFGVRPLQQYLIRMPDGRYQVPSLCWDTRPAEAGGQRWFHLYPDEQIDHADPMHWTGPLQNWNYMCAECHSTGLRKNYNPDEDRFQTTWFEIDVSCEACHGPGSRHLAWAKAADAGRPDAGDPSMGLALRLKVPDESAWIFDDGAPTARRNAPLPSNPQVDVCGRCHARRTQVWPEYRHGQPLADSHRVALLDEHLYHADGQILDEVYVYGSFLQSRMHHKGVTCTDCHEPHSARLLAQDNAVCIRCHLAPSYDTPEHHFHQEGSTGALCVECHMPARHYMVVDPRRDHSFRVPRPDLSVELGTPNACNDCHRDRSPQWADEAVIAWYGPERSKQFHYGQALDAGRRGRAGAADLLLQAADDPEVPGIARATAVSLLRSHLDRRSLAAIERAVRDDDPLVRRAAVEVLDALDPQTRWRLGAPLLSDPIRTVRLEAVSVLADAIAEVGDPGGLDAFERAVVEFRQAQLFNGSRAESHLNLGNLDASLGHVPEAEAAYRRAISMQPSFVPAYVNLADLLRVTGRDEEGERVLRDALVKAPENAAVHHALGLLLIRRRRTDEALDHLAIAVTLRPEQARYGFVYGVALHDLGDMDSALTVLEQAHARSPANRDLLQALVSFNAELGKREIALDWARRLAHLSPDDPTVRRMIEALEGPP